MTKQNKELKIISISIFILLFIIFILFDLFGIWIKLSLLDFKGHLILLGICCIIIFSVFLYVKRTKTVD